ncbi:MAG: hypothetical protein JST27_09740 [Bacteroidetes bacterium]|nr:hypothetical protein [Bacteroidota bacterium]
MAFLFREKERLLRLLIGGIVVLGIGLRLLMYFQNRNLIIDEANIVRNLAERGFGGLLHPLSYEQYAPPVFLWIEKGLSLMLGLSEKALRLYPLLCGIGSMLLFPAVARKFMRQEALWLPLAYLACGYIYVRYSSELKQYMPDLFIALLLLWLALRWDRTRLSGPRFLLYWALAGSVAIWSSMPSVFILAGIVGYYAWPALRDRRHGALLPVLLVTVLWLGQFLLYYFSILKAQIGSSYLQNYHQPYFLYALPKSLAEWQHNWNRLEDILSNIGGWNAVATLSNLFFFLVGVFQLFRKNFCLLLLAGLPILLVLLAACLHQFSLIDRVILFMMPCWLLLTGVGFDACLRWSKRGWVLVVFIGMFNGSAYLAERMLHPYPPDAITRGMNWIQERGGSGPELFVHHASVPAYIYYTQLKPDKARYTSLFGAHLLRWDDDYAQITSGINDTAYFLFTGGFPEAERTLRTTQIGKNMRQVAYYSFALCSVYQFVPKGSIDTSGNTPN